MSKFTDQKLHDFDLTKSGQVSDGEYDPPQLSAAVAHAMPSGAGPLFDLDPYREAMPKVFKHFYERLTKGLDEAWKSSWGYGGDIVDSPEENWARQFAEMFIFTSYMGVAEAYKTKRGDMGRWDMEYSVRLAYGEEDPAYPIVGACQHLSNHMLLTRGFPAASLGTDGIGAGVNKGLPCFSPAYGGSWTVTSTDALTEIGGYRGVAAVRAKLIAAGKGDLTPGSQFGFNADGPEPKKWNDTHIGGVLRIWPEKGPGSQYQPMDTGVLAGSAEGGTEDHGVMTSIAGMADKMVGIGVVKSVKPSAALIQFLTTARPLGYAHLIVADAGGIVRYVSRALPMHLGEKGFAISRYIWSVRCFPANGRAIWLISIPQVGELSKVLLARGARSRPLRDMVAEASAARIQNAIAKGRKKPDVLQPKNGQVLDPVNVIASTTGIPDQGHVDRRALLPGALGLARWRLAHRDLRRRLAHPRPRLRRAPRPPPPHGPPNAAHRGRIDRLLGGRQAGSLGCRQHRRSRRYRRRQDPRIPPLPQAGHPRRRRRLPGRPGARGPGRGRPRNLGHRNERCGSPGRSTLRAVQRRGLLARRRLAGCRPE